MLNLEKVLAKDPYYMSAYTNLANIWVTQNNIEKALEIYFKGLSLDPDKVRGDPGDPATAYFNVGSILLHRGMLEEAVYFLETGLAINLENAAAYELAGQARMRRKNYPLAIEHFRNALKLDPDRPISRSYLEQHAKQQQQEPKGFDDNAFVNELYPENISLHLMLGDFFLNRKDLERAKIQYGKILKMDPSHSEAKAGLAK
jgi:tetratricopeptide (TPR) repeat protein